MSTPLKRVHDRLLADRPTDAKHDALSCPFCLMDSIDEGGLRADAQPGGDEVSDQTYSQADLEAAIAKAVADATAPLQSRLEEIDSKAAQEAREAEIAALRTEADQKVSDIQAQLDTAVAEKVAAEQAKTELETFLTSEAERQEQEAAIAARREERIAKVKEVASFPDEYVEANAERFAAMADEDFEARLEEWRTIARPAGGDKPPATTAITAAREDTADGKGNGNGSLLGELRTLRGALADPRTL